jgi:alpha-L-rhamnosidase
MFGSIGEWFFKALAGLQPDPEMAGRGHFIIRPQPARNLTWVKGEYRSVRGPVASEWHVAEGNINLRVAIPANMSATVYVPTRDSAAVKESGRPAGEASAVRFLRTEAEAAVYEVGSGDFVFEAPFVPAGAAQLNRH